MVIRHKNDERTKGITMKCKKCGLEVKPVLSKQDIHRKFKEWICPKCGAIKSQYIIDGEIIRTYIKGD